MPLYFAYGSNMDRAGMAARCPGAIALGPAVLEGHRFVIGVDGWASAEVARDGNVLGVMWQIMPQHRAALDVYEAVDEGLYDARTMPLRRGEGTVSAMTYILRRPGHGTPRPDYIALIAAAARDWNFPGDYVRMIEGWANGHG